MSQLSEAYKKAYPKAYVMWLRASGMQPIADFIYLDKPEDFWRCRFCGRANDNDVKSCSGCGAHERE